MAKLKIRDGKLIATGSGKLSIGCIGSTATGGECSGNNGPVSVQVDITSMSDSSCSGSTSPHHCDYLNASWVIPENFDCSYKKTSGLSTDFCVEGFALSRTHTNIFFTIGSTEIVALVTTSGSLGNVNWQWTAAHTSGDNCLNWSSKSLPNKSVVGSTYVCVQGNATVTSL